MPPQPDPRWQYILGGLTPDGQLRSMSFEVLEELASEWADLVPGEFEDRGPALLLRMARSMFVHAWFDYEFMAVGCAVGFQAMEAAFRELYGDAGKKPFKALVTRARDEEVLPHDIADLALTGVELRNWLSHPATQAGFTVGMAAPTLENTHRLVALVMAATPLSVDAQGTE